MELHEWCENVVDVENHQFLEENCEFLLSEMKIMKMKNSSLF